MIQIPLANSDKVALIDKSDFEWANCRQWFLHKARYAYCSMDGKSIFMHRLILGLQKGDGLQTDHVNGNGLDNRRCNLRLCNHQQNQANSRLRVDNKSGYKGVYWFKAARKWKAQIRLKKERVYLGLFDDIINAAKAYDKAAREHFGEFARTNF